MRHSALSAVALLLCAACGETTITAHTGGSIGAVVLNGYGDVGVTVLPANGGAPTHIGFGSAFDGAVFTVLRDTAFSTSSKLQGDQLFIADLRAATVQVVQLPAASNPGGVNVLPPGATGSDSGTILVALRDSSALAQLRRDGSGFATRLLRDAGRCPFDVILHGADAWSVDANEKCEGLFEVLGPGRLIRIPLVGGGRDTIQLPPQALGTARAFAIGDFGYVFGFGDFATGAPATVTRVNLVNHQVVATLTFPPGMLGTDMTLGQDGRLYVTASAASPYAPRVFAIDPVSMTFVGTMTSGAVYLALRKADGTAPACVAATADRSGRVYCVENGDVLATVYVFDELGDFVRSAPAGTLAFDIAVR